MVRTELPAVLRRSADMFRHQMQSNNYHSSEIRMLGHNRKGTVHKENHIPHQVSCV